MRNKEAVKKLLGLLKDYRKIIALIIACLLISTGLNMCIPLLNRGIMDYGFIGGDKELLIKQVICSLLIYMIIAVIDIIKEIDTTLLGIEITETGELNSNQYYNFCIGLEKGKRALILDDYGSGFSNVHRLTAAKPQYIKIDHSFTKHIIKSDYYRKILKNTITDVIKSLGADYMQGCLFARPMDKHSFIKNHKRMSENFLNN